MIIKHLLWSLALICGFASANPLDKFVQSMQEQDQAVPWVKSSAIGTIDDSQARSIVSDAYAHGYSKNINPSLILAIMRVESRFFSKAKSREGAKGIMQVLPRFHKDKLAGRDPYQNKVSTEVGTTILQDCLIKNNSNIIKGLRCYNGAKNNIYANKVIKYQMELKRFIVPTEDVLAVLNN